MSSLVAYIRIHLASAGGRPPWLSPLLAVLSCALALGACGGEQTPPPRAGEEAPTEATQEAPSEDSAEQATKPAKESQEAAQAEEAPQEEAPPPPIPESVSPEAREDFRAGLAALGKDLDTAVKKLEA